MTLFQLGAITGSIGGAMAGVCYGRHHGPWGFVMGGVFGGVLGFFGGIVMAPATLLFGHVMDKLERKIGPSLRRSIVLRRKKPDKNDGVTTPRG